MSSRGQCFRGNSWRTGQAAWSTVHSGKACTQQNSSSSSSSAADVDVHSAWDNYDLVLPVSRRCSDDRCSLLTQWTNSTASLKSCVSHNAEESRLTAADSVSTTGDSDGATDRRRRTARGHRHETASRRFVDVSLSARPSRNQSKKCDLAGPAAVRQRHDCWSRRGPVGQSSSSSWRDVERSRPTQQQQTARRRRATARIDFAHAPLAVTLDDEDFVTTSSDDDDNVDEDHPSTSASSSAPAPANCVDDRASLLSCSTTSSSVPPPPGPSRRSPHRSHRKQPAEPSLKSSSRRIFQSPRRRTSTGYCRSPTTNDIHDDDDDELDRSKSSEEVTEAVAGQPREDELRAARSLFEFRSRDELLVANNFIDGFWTLCSRRSLYNERCMYAPLQPQPASLFQFYYSRSEKDYRSDAGCDAGDIVVNDDRKLTFNNVTGNEQLSLRAARNDQDVVIDDPDDRQLHIAELVEQCDCVGQLEGWNGWRREFRFLEVIEELNDVTATINDDDLQIYIRKSLKTFDNSPADDTLSQDTETPDNEQLSVKATRGSKNIVNDDHADRYLSTADIEHCDSVCADGWRKDFRSLEVIEELSDVTAIRGNEDDFEICIRKTPPITFNSSSVDSPGNDTEVTGTEHREPLPKPAEAACDKHADNATVLYALSDQRNETDAIGKQSPGLSTLLTDLLASGSGVKTLTEAADRNSRSSAELVKFFNALLVQSGVAETKSVKADIETFQPLSAGDKESTSDTHPDASKSVQVDAVDGVATATRGSLSRTVISCKQTGFNRNKHKKKREKDSDISRKLTSGLLVKAPRLACDLESTKPIESMPFDTINDNTGCVTSRNCIQTKEFKDEETRPRLSRRSRGRGKVSELIKLFESASAPKLDSSATPSDVKRATISAAVSVGQLLRRASEQEVMMSGGQSACALLDVHAKQTTVPSARSSEVLCSADVAQAPYVSGDKCPSSPEAEAVVQKSTARWPTMSRIRRKNARRRVCTTSAGDGATLRMYRDGPSELRNSRLDVRPASANDDISENLPYDDNGIGETSKADTSWNEDVHLANDDSSQCQCASKMLSANSSLWTEIRRCDVANVASTSNPLNSPPIVVSGRPTVADSTSLLSSAPREENLCKLPSSSSSSSSHRPSKLPQTCEVVVTANALSPSASCTGDVGGRHETGKPASRYVNKCPIAHFNDSVHPSTNYTACGRLMISPRGGLPPDQPLSTVTPDSANAMTKESEETPSLEVATNDDCQRFNARSWFIAGGPRLLELPERLTASRKDVAAIVHRGNSRRRHTRKATFAIETGCQAVHSALRITDATVHLLNKVDVNSTHLRGANGNDGAEYSVDWSSGAEKRQSITKQPRSREVQAVRHRSSRGVAKVMQGDEKLCEQLASKKETVCRAAATKSTEFDPDCDVIAASGGDARTLSTRTRRDRLEGDRSTINSTQSSIRRSSDVASSRCPHQDPVDEPQSSKQFNTTSTSGTSSTTANCGLVPDGEPTRCPGSVTVVHSRRRSTSDRPSAVTFETPAQTERTQQQATERYKRLAQQFLLTSLLEYRLDIQRK